MSNASITAVCSLRSNLHGSNDINRHSKISNPAILPILSRNIEVQLTHGKYKYILI